MEDMLLVEKELLLLLNICCEMRNIELKFFET